MTIQQMYAERKKALIATCTLGLSTVPYSMIIHDNKDAHKGMSFADNGLFSFLYRLFWILLSITIVAVIKWLISIVNLIYYSIVIHKHEKQLDQSL